MFKDPERKKAYDREYRKNNPEAMKAYHRARYLEKKEEILAKKRERYKLNREKHLKTMREYAQTHKEERNAYREANREHMREYDCEYYKNRMATDVEYKIKRNLRSRVSRAMRGIGAKSDKTMNLIGCTVEEFKKHIEAQFTEGMSWDNYGHDSWHLDHKTPCASFDLTDPEEQKACFHYENMQPLWAVDNLSKGAKV